MIMDYGFIVSYLANDNVNVNAKKYCYVII